MIKKDKIFNYILIGVFVLSLITNWYYALVIILSITLLVMMLDKLGKGIVLRELMALHTVFVCLLMPLVGYIFYDQSHHLSRMWVKYMSIPFDVYFGFSLPAIAGFTVALCWPLSNKKEKDDGAALKEIIERSKGILKKMPKTGIYLMILGIISFTFSGLLPVVLQFAFSLFFFASFAGFLYIYFLPKFKKKALILSLFAFFIFANALQSGMFTIVAYMGITLMSYFFVGRKISLWKKISFFVVGVAFIFALQSVKQAYRQYTWRAGYEGNKLSLFYDLLHEQISGSSNKDFSDVFFPMYVRGNQGFNVAMVMKRIPYQQDFDGGHTLFVTILSSFVPRVFWTDKPEAGGKYNMQFYTGYIIEGWSTNVGPLGEAYGSFGVNGGILYMTCLGLVVWWSYRLVFRIAHKIPLFLFWVPVIFYQITYSAESDTLQILNSLVKSGLFVWVLYRFKSDWFGVIKKPFSRGQDRRSAWPHINTQPNISD